VAKAIHLASLKAISNAALASQTLPRRLKVLDWGVNKTLKGDVVLDEHSATVFSKNQREIGRERAPIDFNHNTLPGTAARKELDGKPPVIFGYGTPNLIPGDGLYWDDIVWTPDGEKSARNFHDISPAPLLDDHNRLLAVHSIALTEAGAVEGLSFYSAFDSMDELTQTLETGSARPSVPLSTNSTGLEIDSHNDMEIKHIDHFRKLLKLDPGMKDEEVKGHVLKALAAHVKGDGGEADGVEHLSALFGARATPMAPAIIPVPGLSADDLRKAIADAITPLSAEIEALKQSGAKSAAEGEKKQREGLIAQASKDGKVIPLNNDEIFGSAEKGIPSIAIGTLTSLIAGLPAKTVPTSRRTVAMGADGKPVKLTLADSAAAINAQIGEATH